MIDPTRQEILHALERLSELTPDVRFGQLIVNLSCIAKGPTPEAVWDMEDDELLAATFQHLRHPVQDLAAVVSRRAGPPRERGPGRGDRVPRVLA